MARENTGLQIALIVFVMLTIILAVTTFIFFTQAKEADEMYTKADKDKTDAEAAVRTAQEEINDLKVKIGFETTKTKAEIDEEVNNDWETYAASVEKENQNYRFVLQYLHGVIQKTNESLAAEQAQYQLLEQRKDQLVQQGQAQAKQFEAAAQKASDDLAARQKQFDADRTQLTQAQSGLADQLAQARQEADDRVAAVEGKLEEVGQELQQLALWNQEKSKIIEDIRSDTFEVPDGKIRWVNQRAGTVWISLGRADALGRHTTFSVYAPDTNDVTTAGKKASIEVIQLLGDHLAEARILEDKISDPIMPGDLIHTPIWAPGQREHFALSSGMDIDGDGRSDLATVENLITMNGGVVDATLDDTGERKGKMTTETRYIVLGEEPDALPQNEAIITERSRMIREAEKLGIRAITLKELLNRMGWKNQTPVVTYGPGANPADFRARPPEGVPRTSSGNVTDLFRKRTPPGRAPRSAY